MGYTYSSAIHKEDSNMRLFIATMMSVVFAASMVAFVLSFSACDNADEKEAVVDVVETVVEDVVEETTDAVEDTVEDVIDEAPDETDEDPANAPSEDSETASILPDDRTELIVFNADGKVIFSQVISNI
jgi:hypothetical protein